MRRIISVLCLSLVCLAISVKGQDSRQKEKWRAIALPQEMVMAVAVPQPDCPLAFENLMAIRYLDGYLAGHGDETYQLRNRGSKPIRAYKVASFVTSLDHALDASEVGWPTDTTNRLLMPGQAAPLSGEGHELEIVPLTEELRDKLKLRGPMKGILYFMVVRVEFADGTTYNDEKTFKALEAFQNSLGLKLDRN
jgi:hypothetical protein